MSSAKLIAFDCETYDPNLLTNGPGGVRKDGRLIGISVATDTGFRGYYPIGHAGEGNLDRNRVLQWAKETLENSIDKVGANILYDLEWLKTVGLMSKAIYTTYKSPNHLLMRNGEKVTLYKSSQKDT